MFNNSQTASSSGGVATAKKIGFTGEFFQVQCKNITTGNGVVTVTAKVGNDQTASSIVGGTINLAAPIALVIRGKVNTIIATSSDNGDVFDLEVNS
jgi:hypothetical protein